VKPQIFTDIGAFSGMVLESKSADELKNPVKDLFKQLCHLVNPEM